MSISAVFSPELELALDKLQERFAGVSPEESKLTADVVKASFPYDEAAYVVASDALNNYRQRKSSDMEK